MLGGAGRESLAARIADQGVVVSLPARPSDDVCSVLALDFDAAPVIARP
ncbi:MAG: hypothetical protein H3C62_17085 [Gemmatimonadaceae bacterium]|nr:hypothetical protein [Gemmatimonadaceae bacterium]